MDIPEEKKYYVTAHNYPQAVLEIKSKALRDYFNHYSMQTLKGSKRKQKRAIENWLDKQEMIIQEIVDTRGQNDKTENHDRTFVVGSRLYGKAFMVKMFYEHAIKRITYTRTLDPWDAIDTAIAIVKASNGK